MLDYISGAHRRIGDIMERSFYRSAGWINIIASLPKAHLSPWTFPHSVVGLAAKSFLLAAALGRFFLLTSPFIERDVRRGYTLPSAIRAITGKKLCLCVFGDVKKR